MLQNGVIPLFFQYKKNPKYARWTRRMHNPKTVKKQAQQRSRQTTIVGVGVDERVMVRPRDMQFFSHMARCQRVITSYHYHLNTTSLMLTFFAYHQSNVQGLRGSLVLRTVWGKEVRCGDSIILLPVPVLTCSVSPGNIRCNIVQNFSKIEHDWVVAIQLIKDGRHPPSWILKKASFDQMFCNLHLGGPHFQHKSKSKRDQAVRELTSPLREITYHMGSHSVTCHLAEVTFLPLPQPKLVLNLATPKGCTAELT